MSVIHSVKVSGKNRAALIKELKAAIRELGGEESTNTVTEFYEAPEENTTKLAASPAPAFVEEDEVEEVEETEEAPKSPRASKPTFDASGTLDSEGLPWDKRIHASSKALVANGSWRVKRGVDENLVLSVKAELRAAMGNAAPAAQAPVYEVPAQPTHAMQTQVYSAPTQEFQQGNVQQLYPQQQPYQQFVNPTPPTQQQTNPFMNADGSVHNPYVQQAIDNERAKQQPAPQTFAQPAPKPAGPVAGQGWTGAHTLETFTTTFPHTMAALITEGKLNQEYVNSLCAHFNISSLWSADAKMISVIFTEFVKHGLIALKQG